jgi:uncharacterized protein
MRTFGDIQTILASRREEFQHRFGITNLAVFGSVVRGEAREGSDVDILADIPPHMNLFDLMEAELYLCDLLDMDVDLVSRAEIRPELRERILAEAVTI